MSKQIQASDHAMMVDVVGDFRTDRLLLTDHDAARLRAALHRYVLESPADSHEATGVAELVAASLRSAADLREQPTGERGAVHRFPAGGAGGEPLARHRSRRGLRRRPRRVAATPRTPRRIGRPAPDPPRQERLLLGHWRPRNFDRRCHHYSSRSEGFPTARSASDRLRPDLARSFRRVYAPLAR